MEDGDEDGKKQTSAEVARESKPSIGARVRTQASRHNEYSEKITTAGKCNESGRADLQLIRKRVVDAEEDMCGTRV